MSIFTTVRDDAEAPFEKAWAVIAPVIHDDVAPALKAFLSLFASQTGKLILTDGIAAAGGLATGVPFAAVATALVADLLAKEPAIASQDAVLTLQQIQSAIAIGKVANNILTPADKAAVASIDPGHPAAA
jgi:hypothetical protein